jgi:hypothetical protein
MHDTKERLSLFWIFEIGPIRTFSNWLFWAAQFELPRLIA